MGNIKLTIGIPTWNGTKYLPALFESLKKQTFQDFEIIVVDNASSDGSTEILRCACLPVGMAQDDSQRMRLIQNPVNVGFAAGHNQIFALSQSPYYLALNQDVCLESDCLEKLIGFVEAHADASAVAPKLLKSREGNEIDSLGLKVLRSRRVMEIKSDRPFGSPAFCGVAQDGTYKAVFGVSGACALYRRSAIEAAGGLFDESFFAYKEDVDLAYRINSSGGKCYVLFAAVGYHDRTSADSGQSGDRAQAKNKRSQSDLVKYYSYRNHLITLFKNEYWQNFTIDLPWILWYELKKFVYFILFDRGALGGLNDIWRRRKAIRKQRVEVKKTKKLNWQEMRRKIYARS